MQELHAMMTQLWVVWFLVLFVGILAWAYWPSRRRHLDDCGRIPLLDDEAPLPMARPATSKKKG